VIGRLQVDEDVRGLHVAVDEPGGVGGVERVGDLAADRDRALGCQRAVVEDRPEVPPLDVAHRDEERVAGLAGLVDGNHVGVVERRGELGLGEEPLAERVIRCESRGDQLQRDTAVEPEVSAR
jgi:hypothetical protein